MTCLQAHHSSGLIDEARKTAASGMSKGAWKALAEELAERLHLANNRLRDVHQLPILDRQRA